MPRVLKLFRHGEPLSPRVTRLQFRYPGVTQETRERTFPVVRSARNRAFPLRAVPVILLGQFDVFVPPHFVKAPRHRFFPVSAIFRITWATHHLPSCNMHTSHCQSLQAWWLCFFQLPSHNDTSNSHVLGPALLWFLSQAKHATKYAALGILTE